MKLDKHTYEAWLIDQLDGKLSQQQTALLKAFIDANPALGSWEDLTTDLPVIPLSEASYPDQDTLLNIPNIMQQPDELMIAAREGMATAEQIGLLHQQLRQDENWQRTWKLFGAVYFKPDKSIVFPDKKRLLRPMLLPVVSQLGRYAAAAVVLLLLGWGWWFMTADQKQVQNKLSPELAELEKKQNPEPGKQSETGKTTVSVEKKSVNVKPANKAPGSKKATQLEPRQKPAQRQQAIPPMPNSNAVIQLNLSMNENSFLFYEPDLMQQLTLAAIIGQMPEYAQASQPGAGQRVKGRILQQALATLNKPAKMRQKANGIDLWDIAGTGITAYNFLTDNDVQLVKTTHSSGSGSVLLEGNKLTLERKFGKKTE